jgi:hypothetical protein
MALDDTSLREEINEIATQGPKAVHYIWSAVITLPDGTQITPNRVLGIDIHRDYVGNYCDEIYVDIAIGLGTYQTQLVPNKGNLYITMTRTPIQEGSAASDLTADIEAQEMRATILNCKSMAVEGSTTYASDTQAGDMTSIQTVTLQLVDLAIEQTRMQSLGTVVKASTVGDAIKTLVTNIAQGLKVDVNHKILGVDVVTPNNKQVYEHIVIPHLTKAVDVPGYIAHHYGAPYSSGMGAFLQKSIWYIYPLYDLKAYDTAKRTLTVINVPKNRMPTADRTFRRTYNQLIILATGDVVHTDPSESKQLTHGNGVRFADAAKTMAGIAKVVGNKATALRVQNVNELLAQARPNGFNNITAGAKKITSNSFDELGKVAERLGSKVIVTWENSDPGAIFPGMPCRYLYEVATQVFELKGIVLKSQTQIKATQPGLFPGPHRSITALTLFVERTLDWSTGQTVTS